MQLAKTKAQMMEAKSIRHPATKITKAEIVWSTATGKLMAPPCCAIKPFRLRGGNTGKHLNWIMSLCIRRDVPQRAQAISIRCGREHEQRSAASTTLIER